MRVCLLALLSASPALGQPLSPADAVKRMVLPPGFSATCVAHEPMIRQPLSLSFDHRGRLWVLQFLQYPNPAGLKPVTRDRYLRTTWDRVPEPPPRGPVGLDRLTILSDPDADGVFRSAKDFVAGLNLASGFCLGTDGVYIAQPPYLLFYPDRDRDDVPDGDPQVLLSGFGLDDTHSLANSLQWGPDGWLYGAAGSTSTSRVTDPSGHAKQPIEFQQGLWRYHPPTKRFELFSEGGGNTYGLDFDRTGQALAGTNWGGFALLHQQQGAYHVKGFGKHGPLHNPFAYGYFDHVPYTNFQGGHVTCGGIVYQADAYPPEYRDQYIAGNLLSNTVNWHKLTPAKSSFTATHGGVLLDSHDPSFRPVDLIQGPDGGVYVADWYDKRAAHLDPIDDWDKTNGRVYRIDYQVWKNPGPFDLRAKTTPELAALLGHENVWWRRAARLELSGRKKAFTVPPSVPPLEAFWAKPGTSSSDPAVKEWWVRLALDLTDSPSSAVERQLLALDLPADSYSLLAQYAASAKRANPRLAAAMLDRLLPRAELATDPALPLLTWWAVEPHLLAEPEWLTAVVRRAAEVNDGAAPVFERTVRKLLAAGGESKAELARHRLAAALIVKKPALTAATLRGVEAALEDGPVPETQRLASVLIGDDERFLRVRARCGHPDALATLRKTVLDDRAADAERLKWLPVLVHTPDHGLDLPRLLTSAKTDLWRLGLIAALERGDAATTPEALLAAYPGASAVVRKRIVRALLARPAWAVELFQATASGKVAKTDLDGEDARQAVAFNHPPLTKLVEAQFGKVTAATPGEKRARIDSLDAMLRREPAGDPTAGKGVFAKSCAACHKLHGEGGAVGPDLTATDRTSRAHLLTHIVDPSGAVRPEFVTHKVALLDGRIVVGVVVSQTAEALTVASWEDSKAVNRVLPRRDIDAVEPLPTSLMPEGLLDALPPADIRHLFAYLQSGSPRR